MYNIETNRKSLDNLFEELGKFLEDWFGKNYQLFYSDWEQVYDDSLPFALNCLYNLAADSFMNIQDELLPYDDLESDDRITVFMHENQCVWKAGYSVEEKSEDPHLWLTYDLENWEKQNIRVSEFLVNHLFDELYIGARFEYQNAEIELLEKFKKAELLWKDKEWETTYSFLNGVLIKTSNKHSDLYCMSNVDEDISWEKFCGYDLYSKP